MTFEEARSAVSDDIYEKWLIWRFGESAYQNEVHITLIDPVTRHLYPTTLIKVSSLPPGMVQHTVDSMLQGLAVSGTVHLHSNYRDWECGTVATLCNRLQRIATVERCAQ